MEDKKIDAMARAAYETNRAYCSTLGDESNPPWDCAPDWVKPSLRAAVRGVLAGRTPEEGHESWLADKRAAGWKYGPVKDREKREHPCFRPYAELPPELRANDHLFYAVVRAMAAAFGE